MYRQNNLKRCRNSIVKEESVNVMKEVSIVVRVAKWISRPTSNREIAGSIPASDLSTFGKSGAKNYTLKKVCFDQLFLKVDWCSSAGRARDF